MRFSHFLAVAVAASSTAAALSDSLNGHDVENLVARQNNNNNNNQNNQNNNQNNNNNNNNSNNNQPTNTGNSNATPTGGNSDNSTPTGQPASDSQASKVTGKPHSTAFDPQLPAGGVAMITPNPFAGEPFYKVGDYVTFAWNFTSLKVTPSNIDVIASCTKNQATYTIAANISSDQTSVVWDTKNTPTGQAAFLTEQYKLIIYDADSAVTAVPKPGYLGSYNNLVFGMYTPQPYVKYSDFHCPNCNAAMSHFERMTVTAILMTTGTTIGSLLYFTYAFGIW